MTGDITEIGKLQLMREYYSGEAQDHEEAAQRFRKLEAETQAELDRRAQNDDKPIAVGDMLLITDDLEPIATLTWLIWQEFKTASVTQLYIVDGVQVAEIREADTGNGKVGHGKVPLVIVQKLRRAYIAQQEADR